MVLDSIVNRRATLVFSPNFFDYAMSDVRALLKAKRQEARITHPYATYNAAGQLRCAVCTAVVKHASAWEGHLGSKQHRTNVARMREEERQQREQEEAAAAEAAASAKRKAPAQLSDAHAEKKRRVEEPTQGAPSSSFPQDFFSDPSRAPALLSDDSDEEEGEGDQTSPTQPVPGPKETVVDLEYERFQRELLTISADPTEAYDRATVAAEPVLASADIEGFPSAPEVPAAPEPDQPTEAEVRQKREQEERELIMDRLMDEERAQEDADTRVQLLKTKLEALRKRRELAKANKQKTN